MILTFLSVSFKQSQALHTPIIPTLRSLRLKDAILRHIWAPKEFTDQPGLHNGTLSQNVNKQWLNRLASGSKHLLLLQSTAVQF